ncbi:NAD(P)-binding protein [Podospora appendiculata]|uniref:NAD(P)-binding protein n=1 Tax=Podospora appendiculata TaxID=314037 RepID=A0AAE1CH70_9PEZI|nr:NAD(P)-binding protein [Podospora appendiculata]
MITSPSATQNLDLRRILPLYQDSGGPQRQTRFSISEISISPSKQLNTIYTANWNQTLAAQLLDLPIYPVDDRHVPSCLRVKGVRGTMSESLIKFAQPPKIPVGSLILVTGANGLIASHAVDQLLAAGYRVRGSVRDKQRCAWLEPLFEARHRKGQFELIEVPDLAAPGAWDVSVQGVAGIVSVAGCAQLFTKDVEKTVEDEVKSFYGLLEAAKAEPGVKSFVFTSSVWAAWTPEPNVPTAVTEDSWNDKAIKTAEDPSLTDQEKGIAPFMAVKAKVEQACWRWVEREKPTFTFNAILPDTVTGPILDPRNQSASTAGIVRSIYRGENLGVLDVVVSQWFIDARDTGRLYVAALNLDVTGWRVFGCAERFSWNKILNILKSLYPEKKDFVELADLSWDQTDFQTEKPLALLRAVGQEEWTSLEQSIKDLAESFLSA